jgi:hypothetical protein
MDSSKINPDLLVKKKNPHTYVYGFYGGITNAPLLQKKQPNFSLLFCKKEVP